MPTDVVSEIDHSLSRWLEKIATTIEVKLVELLPCAEKLLKSQSSPNSLTTNDGEPIGEPVFEAINHPIGKLASTFITLWFKEHPKDGDGLPTWLNNNLTLICASEEPRFRHGKTIVAQHLIALFRVDPVWTRNCLIPLFNLSLIHI